jgi:alpha-mannosidase
MHSVTAIPVVFLLIFFCAISASSQEPVDKVLNLLGSLQNAPLTGWKVAVGSQPDAGQPAYDDSHWLSSDVHSTDQHEAWYRALITIPDEIAGEKSKGEQVNLVFRANGSAKVYLDGKLAQVYPSGNGERKTPLVQSAEPGKRIHVSMNLHIDNAMIRFEGGSLELEDMADIVRSVKEYSLSLNMAKRLLKDSKEYLKGKSFALDLSRTSPERLKSLRKVLNDAASLVDLNALKTLDKKKFLVSLDASRSALKPVADFAKEYTVYITGNAHIDAAWLWRWHETVEVCKATFAQQLDLMNEYSGYVFSQSSAAFYRWMEELYPDIFQRIQKRAKEGLWEVVGGTIIEPDCNLPGGESWARQLLYGKRYFSQKLSTDVKLGYTPDSFGYNWNLPQFFARSGIEAFITQKISWNDTNEFPYHLFWWEAPDGSRVLTYFPISGYVTTVQAEQLIRDVKEFEANTGLKDVLVLYGFGDHGIGPEWTMLNRAEFYKNATVFPNLVFSGIYQYLSKIPKETLDKLPIWRDELYLEFHRGTLTTQGAVKQANRKNEILLTNSEKLASLDWLMGTPFPEQTLTEAWWKYLFNQFHDILPGSSITPVYRDAAESHQEIAGIAKDVAEKSLMRVASHINTSTLSDGVPLLIFNPLSWDRTDIASVELPEEMTNPVVSDEGGTEIPSQISIQGKKKVLVFVAQKIPAMGYKVFKVKQGERQLHETHVSANNYRLENEYLIVEVSPRSGNISRIFDKASNREVMNGEGNILQCLEDIPTQFDAWEIKYTGKKWELNSPESITLVENGPVQAVIRVKKDFLGSAKSKMFPTSTFPSSFFTQDIILYSGIPRIDCRMNADWWEEHILLKVAFPVTVKSDLATYEIPYSHITRSTNRNNSWERARNEVSAQYWADISDGSYGVSLLNDSKYGYDIEGSMMRLTLLRSPVSPDPQADKGKHSFAYSLYPHKGSWQEANTVRRGQEFNNPLISRFLTPHAGGMELSHSFFKAEPANVVLSAMKKAEDSDALIMRLYECVGEDAKAEITLAGVPKAVYEVDLLEANLGRVSFKGNVVTVLMGKNETKTIKVQF